MAGEGNNSGGNVNDIKKQVMEAQAKAKKSQAEALDDINKFTEKVKEDLSKCLDKITANIDTAYNVDYTRTCWWELWADAAFINSSVLGLSDPDYKMIIDLAKKLAKAAGKGILNLLEVAAEEHKSEMNPYILISRAIINMSTLTGIAFGFYIKTIMSIIMVMTKIFVEFATAKTRLKLLVRKCGSGNSWCEKKIKKGFENLSYFAKGPYTCYCDMQNYAYYGEFESTVDEEYVPLIRPQDCGNHIGAEYCTLDNGKNTFNVYGSNFEFSALHFSPEGMSDVAHRHELKKADDIFLQLCTLRTILHGINYDLPLQCLYLS